MLSNTTIFISDDKDFFFFFLEAENSVFRF